MQKRVTGLEQRLNALSHRVHQADELGDLDNEPQTLFDILGEDAVGLSKFDPARLRQVRLSHTDSRALAAKAFLECLGWEQFSPAVAAEIQIAVQDLEDREQFQAWGLFVDSRGVGVSLGLKVVVREPGQENLWSDANREMTEQAGIALRHAVPDKGWEAQIEWPTSYVGESIGLPLYIAGLVANGRLPNRPLTASTGRLDIGGHITGVASIREKVAAARRIGVRRLIVPLENLSEAKGAAGDDLIVVPVGDLQEVASAFRQSMSARELGYAGLIRLVRAAAREYGLLIQDEIENASGFRFVVANLQGKVNIWIYRNGRVRPDGQPGQAMDAAHRLITDLVPGDPQPRETLPFQLPVQLQSKYLDALQNVGAVEESPGNYENWRVRLSRGRSRATVVLYKSGKCVVQGTGPAWDEAHSQAQQITEELGGLPAQGLSAPAAEAATESDDSEPHIGTDEAGKGDYFGPLVSAAVFVDRDLAAQLRTLGVRDSKTLSDKRVRELAKKIRDLAEGRFAVTPINPRKYNELYEQFRCEGKNLNSLLAWGHGRSIENILNVPTSKRSPAKYVVVDQFADKHYIEQRTKRAGIPIHQHHKAEADIAVAAASVLARDGFLQWLERWSERIQIPLLKGASPQVVDAAKQFVRRWGAKWLGEVAKLHFRTTNQVLEGEDINADKRPPHWTVAADITREG
jgi:ribonuclease HIII